MTNALRKINRKKKNKKKKILKKSLQEIKKRMNSLGNQCRSCNAPFDHLDGESSAEWMVYIIDSQPHLMCPDCVEQIKETKQAWEEEGWDV